jgi:hypothetical protein
MNLTGVPGFTVGDNVVATVRLNARAPEARSISVEKLEALPQPNAAERDAKEAMR